MSVKALSLIFEKFPYGGTDYLTIIALADWSDDDGRCFPSVASVGRKIRLSERQARRSMSNLITGGFVKVIGNKYGGVPGETRRYQIVFDSLTGDIGVPPKAKTGDIGVRDGGHLWYETGDIGVPLTTIEPSLSVRQNTKAKITLSPGGNFENIEDHLVVWKNAYPSLDVMAEIRKAGAWCISNPKKCPKSNFPRFLNGWLSRSNVTPTENIMDGVL